VYSEYIGETTNNVAEYMALIEALKQALLNGFNNANVYSDSLLLISQIKGEYKVKSPKLKELNNEAITLISKFKSINFNHVNRENRYIKIADRLHKHNFRAQMNYGLIKSI